MLFNKLSWLEVQKELLDLSIRNEIKNMTKNLNLIKNLEFNDLKHLNYQIINREG